MTLNLIETPLAGGTPPPPSSEAWRLVSWGNFGAKTCVQKDGRGEARLDSKAEGLKKDKQEATVLKFWSVLKTSGEDPARSWGVLRPMRVWKDPWSAWGRFGAVLRPSRASLGADVCDFGKATSVLRKLAPVSHRIALVVLLLSCLCPGRPWFLYFPWTNLFWRSNLNFETQFFGFLVKKWKKRQIYSIVFVYCM